MFLRAVLPSLSVSRFCRSELARDSSDAVRLLKRGAAIASKLGSYRGGVVLGVSVVDAVCLLKRGAAIASKLGSYRGWVVLGVLWAPRYVCQNAVLPSLYVSVGASLLAIQATRYAC